MAEDRDMSDPHKPETWDWRRVPERMRGGFERYFRHGIIPGSFLTSLLEGDPWHRVIGLADEDNRGRLMDYAVFLHSNAPSKAWGSREAVSAWAERGGLEGRET
jgi:hypothetical protein